MVAACWGQTQTAPAPPRAGPIPRKSIPQINAQFQKADVKAFIKRFESNDREVFVRRHEIVRALGLKPGMAVADVGAGTGLFTRLIADEVGPGGKVYAVDVSKGFLDYIASQAKTRGTAADLDDPGHAGFHHPAPGLRRPGFPLRCVPPPRATTRRFWPRFTGLSGSMVSSCWSNSTGWRDRAASLSSQHIRAGQAEFRREIEAAGFEPGPGVQSTQAQGELRCEIPEGRKRRGKRTCPKRTTSARHDRSPPGS